MNPRALHLPLGTTLGNGKYKILRFIGAGGFGCTYEAEFSIMHSKVAIKEFFVGTFCNRAPDGRVTVGTQSQTRFVELLQEKFLREARNLNRLSHPNIVHVSDILQGNGTSYYVMDFIDGRSLKEMIKAEGPLPEKRAMHYISQILDALEYLHSQKMLHLDIKPANVMIDKNDNAILIDFGVSKQYDEADGLNTSTIMGQTPGYAPLEQTTNTIKQFTPATDIYALGATLYAMLSGITPPPTADLMAGLTYLKPLPQPVSYSTLKAINAMMQPKRINRPQSIAEVRRMLFDGKPVEPAEPTNSIGKTEPIKHVDDTRDATQPKGRKNKSKMWIWITAATLICGIGAAAYFLLAGKNDEPEIIATAIDDNDHEPQQPEIIDADNLETIDYITDNELQTEATEGQAVREDKPSTTVGGTQGDVTGIPVVSPQNGTTGAYNGHQWVDMGTSVLWATANVNGYYAWGEVFTKKEYNEASSLLFGISKGNIGGSKDYDCARVNWGGGWRMPLKKECQELIDNCEWTWTGSGIKFTAKNGNTITLPADGFWGANDIPIRKGSFGSYWTASTFNDSCAWSLTFDSKGPALCEDYRYWGRTIRPVLEKNH